MAFHTTSAECSLIRANPDTLFSQWIARAVVASIVCSVISVAGSGIFLGAAVALWGAEWISSGRFTLRFPPFAWFLVAFMATIVVAIIFSTDPLFSLHYLKKSIRLVLVVFIYTYLKRDQVEWTLKALFVLLALSSCLGLIQYFFLFDIDLLNRITGFMSHWMTFSGQLMIGFVALSGLLLTAWQSEGENGSGWKSLLKPTPFLWCTILCLYGTTLLLTFTRNAWLGTLLGVGAWLVLVGRRRLLLLGMLLALLLFLLPGPFQRRVLDGFDLTDTTTRTRLELLMTGSRMISDHPLTGVGPRMVPRLADRYRSNREFPDWLYQHLHNSPLQIAAETGFLGVAAWIALWVFLIFDLRRMARWSQFLEPPSPMTTYLCLNGICVVIAFLGAGLLEYNYGDSELVTLLMFFMTAPYVHSEGIQAVA